ncbi:MAG: hypothetical protein EKK64_04270 [Neisseriaceae bacterium]|nr:MAG: hypothetical protein EKK64_04270 [Neisseriaceae bacterium]
MIKYIEGDLFEGIKQHSCCLIPHITNNVHAWGLGFVLPLSKHFPQARTAFFSLRSPELGAVQFVECGKYIICNMFAQNGIRSKENPKPIDYKSLERCMEEIRLKNKSKVISAPMFGSGLAGGEWSVIESLIEKWWGDFDVEIYFFEKSLPRGYSKKEVNSEVKICRD